MSTAANVLAGILGVLFLISGGFKLTGMKVIRDNFRLWRYPDAFRVFTGVWEVAGGALLLTGIATHGAGLAGAILILTAMLGAVYTHVVRVPEPKAVVLPVVLLATSAAAAALLAATL
jgi:putative oxidoreductase